MVIVKITTKSSSYSSLGYGCNNKLATLNYPCYQKTLAFMTVQFPNQGWTYLILQTLKIALKGEVISSNYSLFILSHIKHQLWDINIKNVKIKQTLSDGSGSSYKMASRLGRPHLKPFRTHPNTSQNYFIEPSTMAPNCKSGFGSDLLLAPLA